MLDGAVGMQMILLTISYVRLVAGPHEIWFDDKAGVGLKICHCARFLVMLWPFFLIYVPAKDNMQRTTDPISEKIRHFCMHPLQKNSEFKFWLPPFLRAKSWFDPPWNGDLDESTLQFDLGHGQGHHMTMDFIICEVTPPKRVVLPVCYQLSENLL